MIDVSELITDPVFCQPQGIKLTRFATDIVDHKVVESSKQVTIPGIIVALSPNNDELLDSYNRNSEEITILTLERLKCTGEDKDNSNHYGSDIIHYRNNDYIVRSCQDLGDYGYYRSKAYKIEQDTM